MIPIDQIGTSLGAETETLQNNLATAMASGSEHDIRVELDALRTFYDNLWEVESVLHKAQQATKDQALVTEIRGIGTTIGEIFDGSVPGVDDAVTAAQNNLSGSSDGLGSVLPGLHAIVIKNLRAVYDTYMAYLNADDGGASGLSSAASKTVDQSWNTNAADITATVIGNELKGLQIF
jgi:hypothetical protein